MASFSCTDEFWGGIKLNIILSYCGVKDFLLSPLTGAWQIPSKLQ